MKRCWALTIMLLPAPVAVCVGQGAPPVASTTSAAEYTAEGRLKFPERYREWVYLSSGLDMRYTEEGGNPNHSMFDNVFVDPRAYQEFLRTGKWADGTMLVLEARGAAEKGSINQHGHFQTREVMGVEVHVKDTKRFQGGWAFVAFRGREPTDAIPQSADCYSCHREHGAVDTTFVQFYPTLLDATTRKESSQQPRADRASADRASADRASADRGAGGNPVSDPSKTTYGEISPNAPKELHAFSFLVGKWDGKGKTKLPNGTVAEFPVSCIGRYVFDGMAIADEMHAPAPDGSPFLGISLLQYDPGRKTWIVEFLNVSGSFLRKQVNSTAGSVEVSGRNVTVASESPGVTIREHYLVPDDRSFTYRLDVSNDGGRSWSTGQIEMTLHRVE